MALRVVVVRVAAVTLYVVFVLRGVVSHRDPPGYSVPVPVTGCA
jgi:hypothetical protein